MNETEIAVQKKTSSTKRPGRERGWTWWLIPKPFDLVSSLLYLGVLAAFLYNFLRGVGYPSKGKSAVAGAARLHRHVDLTTHPD